MKDITKLIWKANDSLLHGRYKYVKVIEIDFSVLDFSVSIMGRFLRELPGRCKG